MPAYYITDVHVLLCFILIIVPPALRGGGGGGGGAGGEFGSTLHPSVTQYEEDRGDKIEEACMRCSLLHRSWEQVI